MCRACKCIVLPRKNIYRDGSFKLLRSPGIDSKESSPPAYVACRARICKPFKESMNRFPASRTDATTLFVVPARQATSAGGIDSLESIPGLHKSLPIRALGVRYANPILTQFLVPIGCSKIPALDSD